MAKVRMGVIGAGWWGTVGHLQPLSQDDRVELVALYSRSADKALQQAAKYGVPRHYTDYRQMIDECALDAVSIATTPNVHYEQALYALERGVNVLMEKPFVLHAAEAEHLAQVAQEKGLKLSVCYPFCFHPWAVEARRAIRSGQIGDIVLVHRIFAQRVYDLYKGDVPGMFDGRPGDHPTPNAASYSDPAIAGGGEGHTQATHALGELLFMTGLRPVSVFAFMNNLDTRVDVVDAMTIRFEGGALGTVSANGQLPARMGLYSIEIVGLRGMFAMDSRYAARLWLEGQPPHELAQPESHPNTVEMVTRNFVRAVLGVEQQHVETEVAVSVVRILDAAYRSAASGQVVNLQGPR
jgi:predicted dehydrogenase